MRTIKQPEHSALCGAACVAMITDKELSDIMPYTIEFEPNDPFFDHYKGSRYMNLVCVIKALADFNFMAGLCCVFPDPINFSNYPTITLTPDNLMERVCLLTVVSKPAMHMVVWDPEVRRVRDPLIGRPELTPLSEYEVADVIPVTKIEGKY